MHKRIRIITVNNIRYAWVCRHKVNLQENTYISRVYISLENSKTTYIECFFESNGNFMGGCHLKYGFFADKNGKEEEINFSCPKIIAEIIDWLTKNEVDFTKKKIYRYKNGWNILMKIGYKNFRSQCTFNGRLYEKPEIAIID